MTNEVRRREIVHLRRMVGTASNNVSNALTEAEGAEVSPLLVERLQTASYYVDRALDEFRGIND